MSGGKNFCGKPVDKTFRLGKAVVMEKITGDDMDGLLTNDEIRGIAPGDLAMFDGEWTVIATVEHATLPGDRAVAYISAKAPGVEYFDTVFQGWPASRIRKEA